MHQGQAFVTAVINAAMKSPDWTSSAIFLSWGRLGRLLRPGAAPRGRPERVRSSDAYLKFIEDDYLGGARLDPRTDGRPDSRLDVREDLPLLGYLVADFNFGQPPRSPVLPPVNPPTDSPTIPAYFAGRGPCPGCTTPPPE